MICYLDYQEKNKETTMISKVAANNDANKMGEYNNGKSRRMAKKILTFFFAVAVIIFWVLLLRYNDNKLKEAQKHWTEREWDMYFDYMENRPCR